MSTNSPNKSFGRRKSVNWAHPISTVSPQFKGTSTIKRSSPRLRGNKAPAINGPFSEIIQTEPETENNLEKMVDSLGGKCTEASEETNANCVIAYFKPLNEQLHRDSSIKAMEGWVSVPLDNIESEKWRNPDRNLFEDNKSSFKVLRNDPPKMTSLERTLKSKMETMNEIVDKELRDAHARSKKVVHDLEQTISKRRENKLQKLQSEKEKIKAIAALEQERLRDEITLQSQNHAKVIEEKLAIERDRDALKKDFSSKVAKELDTYRLKRDRDHAEIVATLTMELRREQEKNLCQICFTSSRDAIVLPCLHFQYCNECLREHQRRQTECPTCRAMINGVISCNFRILS